MKTEIVSVRSCFYLKELQKNISENYFCVRHRNRRKHYQRFKLLFSELNSRLGSSKLNTYMLEIKFTSHKQYLFGHLFSIKVKDSYRPKYTSSFLTSPNRKDSQTCKSSSYKKAFLQCVCSRGKFLRWMFFVPCHDWKTLFCLKVFRHCEIFSSAILPFSLKQVSWKKSIFYVISTITVQC